MEHKEITNLRVNLTGCSGIGKTTLAKCISEEYGIPFISGSYSDLVPETKSMKHSDMIIQDAHKIFEQDVMVLNRRKKLFDENTSLVSDRSYIDSAAYMINKLSHRLPTCEIEDFIQKCLILTLLQCPKIIYVPFTTRYFNDWKLEDNGKRVTNPFYQAEITQIIDWLIWNYWHCTSITRVNEINPVVEIEGDVDGLYTGDWRKSQILILNEIKHQDRMNAIRDFLAL